MCVCVCVCVCMCEENSLMRHIRCTFSEKEKKMANSFSHLQSSCQSLAALLSREWNSNHPQHIGNVYNAISDGEVSSIGFKR